jgi:hypothetical protein
MKCSFTIIDHSNHEMKVDFFEKAVEHMPPRPNLGDLVLIRNIKVSMHVPFSVRFSHYSGPMVSVSRVALKTPSYRMSFFNSLERPNEKNAWWTRFFLEVVPPRQRSLSYIC